MNAPYPQLVEVLRDRRRALGLVRQALQRRDQRLSKGGERSADFIRGRDPPSRGSKP